METRGFSNTKADPSGSGKLAPSLLNERWWPFAFALLCTGALYFLSGSIDIPERLFDSVTAFASIMAGFVSTLLGILFSIRDTGKVKLLRGSGHFKQLKDYLYVAVLSSMFLAALGLFASAIIECSTCYFFELVRVLWVYFIALTFFTCYRAITLIHKLL